MIEKKAATLAVEQMEAANGGNGEISQEEIEKKAAELAVDQIEKEK